MTRDSLLARLRAAFVEDLEEHLATLSDDLLALEADPRDAERLRSTFRAFHTVKGAARAADLPGVERVCHEMESRLVDARDGAEPLGREQFRLLFAVADALRDTAAEVRAGRDPASGPTGEALRRLEHGEIPAPAPAAAPPPPPERADERVRVDAARLDQLLATVSQLSVAQRQQEERIDELARWVERHGLPTAPTAERPSLQRLLQSLRRSRRAAALELSALSYQLRQMRLRPIDDAFQALPRAARDVAAASGKEVQLLLEGQDVQADRAVIDALRDSLLHAVRNAVDHGIEPPAERRRLGKPERGTVRVTAIPEGDRIRVLVQDDGRGVDEAALHQRLRAVGRAVPAASSELARLLLLGGISSRDEASAISGRGVGMDAIRAALEGVRGTVRLSWEAGRGTTLSLRAPLAFATTRVLMFRSGGHELALPTGAVETVASPRVRELGWSGGERYLRSPAGPVSLVPLAALLGDAPADAGPDDRLPVVTVRVDGRRLALAVDRLLTEREVTVRPLDTGGRPLPLFSGGIPLSNGTVALVIDPVAVLDSAAGVRWSAAPQEETGEPLPRHRILVVDDSITTRTLERITLETAGYEVETAVDGAAGLAALQEHGADLVVTDVEMPNMDGLQLCAAIRASARFADLPVIVVSSLDRPEHRARGKEAGADAYLGKSEFSQQSLLELVRRLLAEGAG